MPLVRAEEIPGLSRIRAAVFGRNGSGKTTLHSTIPEIDSTGTRHRVMVASVDVENLRPYTQHNHYRIWRMPRWDENLELYDTVVASLSSKAPVTDLVLDTWSRMQDLAIGKVTGYNPTDPGLLRQYIERIPKRPSGWDGWGQVGALLNEWLAIYARLPINLYALVQENDRENKTDNYTETGPRLTPEAVRGLRDSMEIVGRMYVVTDDDAPDIVPAEDGGDFDPLKAKKGGSDSNNRAIDPNAQEERRLFIGQHERYQTKGPTHLLGRVIVNPTWDTVYLPVLTQTAPSRQKAA